MAVIQVKAQSGESNVPVILTGDSAPGSNPDLDSGTYAPGSIYANWSTGIFYVLAEDGTTWRANSAS